MNRVKKISFGIISIAACVGGFALLKSCGFMGMSKALNDKPNRAVPLIPVEDFFKNPSESNYGISPDGRYLSYLAPYKNRMNLFIREGAGENVNRITSDTLRDILYYEWVNNLDLIYLQDIGGEGDYKLYVTNRTGDKNICLTCFQGVRTEVIDLMEDSENEILISMNKRNPSIFDAYKLNIHTGQLTLVAENPGNISEWITDHKGKIRVAVTANGLNNDLLYREKETDAFRTVVTVDFKETLEPLFFTPDNKDLYCLSNIGRDKMALVILDPSTGEEKELVYSNFAYDLSDVYFSEKRKVLTEAVFISWKKESYFFDPLYKSYSDKIAEKLDGEDFYLADMDRSETHFIVRSYSDKSMGSYYLYDTYTNHLDKIADVAPWLQAEYMAEIKPVFYKSRDGLTINGYLTIPLGTSGKNLPVVINPHGGPWTRNVWGFNPEVQFLVNRGYAVFQMNYRGSTGYGKDFWKAGFKEWGGEMQADITDGVNWLIEEGIADKERIAIYGASYGGYCALSGICQNPDMYCCAVDYVGVSNLFTFMNSIPAYWQPYMEMMKEMVGDPERDSALFVNASPFYNIGRIQAPVFIAQGANDVRVSKSESDQIVMALRNRGVEVEYLVKPDEGHGFTKEENRLEFYMMMENFLQRYLSPEVNL